MATQWPAAWRFDSPHGEFPAKPGAIAFGGGGFKSVGAFWPVLYHLSKTHDLREMLDGNHIGAASGGGWFFTNLVFNRAVWESISTGKSEEAFMSVYRAFFGDIVQKLEANQRALTKGKLAVLKRCLGHAGLKDILESQGFPLFDETMLQWMSHYLIEHNGWKLLNNTLSSGQELTPNANLSLTCDMANGILTDATIESEDNWIVDHRHFYHVVERLNQDSSDSEESEDELEAHEHAQIPMTVNVRVSPTGTTHSITLCQEAQSILVKVSSESTGLGFGRCTCRCNQEEEVVFVTKDDIERGCRDMLKDPADICGPTGCYFACFSKRFFSSYMGISNHMVNGLLIELEHKLLHKSFFAIDAIDELGHRKCPLRLVDGGPWDHTGIAVAVKGMQREGRSGDIVAITLYSLESYSNFHVMFTGYDNQGDHCGIAEPPYPRCFKGMPPTGCKAYGKYVQVLDCQVETVDCPAFEILGGRKYRLFYIFLMPEHLNLFPFKQESVDAYVTWCKQALRDLSLWSTRSASHA